ncbi:RDD family protein [Wolbachia endosymbiont of Pentidionis agamae]|uniref:RDD family protein n=1 Tax=Wolbachia endosymbiont of Pentidionis agamae TaxID=3110435 RepID=UPI002FD278A7
MINSLINRFLAILSSISSLMVTQNVKKDENGICYVTGMRRYLSILLDLMIIVLLLYFFGYAVHYITLTLFDKEILSQALAKFPMQVPLSFEEETALNQFIKCNILNQVMQLLMLSSYVTYTWVKLSATPGKLIFGLRVVDSVTFEKITFKQAIKRFFAFILSVVPLFLGFFMSHFNKRCQTWHDKIASTVVVTNKSLIYFKNHE